MLEACSKPSKAPFLFFKKVKFVPNTMDVKSDDILPYTNSIFCVLWPEVMGHLKDLGGKNSFCPVVSVVGHGIVIIFQFFIFR